MADDVESIEIQVLARNSCSTVGESPHWEESTKSVIYVDIRSGDIHRWSAVTKEDSKIHFDGHIGFAVPRESGHYIIGLGPTLCLIDWDRSRIVDQFVSVDAFRFNDGKCDPRGRLWTGTLGDHARQRALFSLENDHRTIVCRLQQTAIANGMAWDERKQLMYFVDSSPRKIFSFRYDADTGDITDRRTHTDFASIGPEETLGKPDGLCIDVNGDLWVACFGGGCIFHIDGDSGEALRKIRIPGAKQVTSCCFGGQDYSDLFVTSARSRLTPEEEKLQPLAGSLFKVTGLNVKGQKPFVYKG